VSLSVEIVLQLLLATVLGAGIGLQRELSGKPAGVRTHSLICLGSALIMIISVYGFEGAFDPSRVAAGMVAGIGFLGAGVIFRGMRGDVVVGLTSAASIWVTAAIGMAAGAGMYLISIIVAVITVMVLMIPKIKG
jgi:putative Mg2+ transporter-C (MgtC) family protein